MPRSHSIEDYRNFGIMAHIDAGKRRRLSDPLLHRQEPQKWARCTEGAATMDFMEQEQERGITITSAATTAFWPPNPRSHRLNIIDTRVTSISPSRWSLAARARRRRSACSIPTRASSHRPRRSGVQGDKYKVPRIVFCNKWMIKSVRTSTSA